jgi:hypothetical protein
MPAFLYFVIIDGRNVALALPVLGIFMMDSDCGIAFLGAKSLWLIPCQLHAQDSHISFFVKIPH